MSKQRQNTKNIAPTFYDRLVKQTTSERVAFLGIPIIQAALNGGITKETYLGYLSEAFHHVRHTVPLVKEVQARVPANRLGIHNALSDYILEKQGHEKWILKDLKNAGVDADGVRDSAPSMETEELLSFAYDFVDRGNPMGFFGMVFVIDGTGSELATHTAEKLINSLDLPKNCFSYLLSHGAPELENMDTFETVTAQITDPDEQDAIIHMAKHMYRLYGDIFRNISEKSGFDSQAWK